MKVGGESTNYVVPGLDRGLRILSLFSRSQSELTMAEIKRRIDLPYGTTYRLLHTLVLHGLLKKTGSGFVLGPGILRLGFDYLSSLSLIEIAQPIMESLRDSTDASSNLGILEGTDIIYVTHVPSRRPLATRRLVGSRMPAHLSSIGRLILGWMSREEVIALFGGLDAASSNGRHQSVGDLLAQVAEDRERGYVISHGIYDPNIVAVAAPILDRMGQAVAGINVSGAISAFNADELNGSIKDEVVQAAARISSLIGYREAVAS